MGNSSVSLPCVLSSGVLLTTLSFPSCKSVHQLKAYLQSLPVLQRQLINPSLSTHKEPTGFRLFAYQGEELKDDTKVGKILQPICVLRPSDRVVVRLALSGKATATVINPEENTYWGRPQGLHLLIFHDNWDMLLCDVLPTETVKSLKKRLNTIISGGIDELKLWYKGAMLEDEKLLGQCGLEDRSRLTLQLPGDSLAIARDIEGGIAVFLAPEGRNESDLGEIAKFCERKWTNLTISHEYVCLFPKFPYISRYLLQSSPCSTLISLLFPNSPPTSLLIPSNSTVEIVKACLESQHNLSSPYLSLTVIGELTKDMTFKDFRPSNGDLLTIFKQKYCEKQLTAMIYYSEMASFSTFFHANDNIGKFFSRMKSIKDPYVLMRGAEVLDEGKTFAECGIFTDVDLMIGDKEALMRKSREMSRFHQIPSESGADSPLFNGLKVQLITSESVLNLQVPAQVSVQTLQTHFQGAVPVHLVHAGKVLESCKSLQEQGVAEGSALLLVPAGSVWVHVETPAGGRLAVVLQPRETMLALGKVLDQLAGIHSHRVVFAKKMGSGGDMLPAATETLAVSLQEPNTS